jgi:hypothetical protein
MLGPPILRSKLILLAHDPDNILVPVPPGIIDPSQSYGTRVLTLTAPIPFFWVLVAANASDHCIAPEPPVTVEPGLVSSEKLFSNMYCLLVWRDARIVRAESLCGDLEFLRLVTSAFSAALIEATMTECFPTQVLAMGFRIESNSQ